MVLDPIASSTVTILLEPGGWPGLQVMFDDVPVHFLVMWVASGA
jgi:hypothetical protein